MISLVAFVTAFVSFLTEVNLAQLLTAALGGTLLRYQTTFAFFTFSLGAGAFLLTFLQKKTKWSFRQVLLFSQIMMILLNLISPWLISTLSIAQNSLPPLLNLTLCYLPIILTGLVSGFELPCLLNLQEARTKSPLRPLTWDYIGMFVASLAFPFYFLYEWGTHQTALLSVLLSAIVIASLKHGDFLQNVSLPSSANSQQINSQQKESFNLKVFALIFLFSFCSFSYELLTAKMLSDIFSNEVLAYSGGIGLLLLGIGIGTYFSQKTVSPVLRLIKVEVLIILLGTILFPLAYLQEIFLMIAWGTHSWVQHKFILLMVFSFYPLALGILTGFELPCLIKMGDGAKKVNLNFAFGFNYFGALLSGLIVPLILIPHFTIYAGLQIVVYLNLLGLMWVLLSEKNIGFIKKISISLVIALFITGSAKTYKAVEDVYLKIYYNELSLDNFSIASLKEFRKLLRTIDPIERTHTAYQNMDKVKNSSATSFFAQDGFTLFLNKQQQLDSSQWLTYHQTFAFVSDWINPDFSPKNVLILGGGDGLLAHLLSEKENIKSITLIELDPEMIAWAKTDSDILELNKDSFNHPKVHVLIGDAYSYVKENRNQFDAIYIDLPYPDSYELSRLYSIEFYSFVKERLSPNGFIIFDAPIWRYIDSTTGKTSRELKILSDTLSAAGFETIFPLGAIEPFIWASVEKQEPIINYDLIPDTLPNSTFSNLASLDFLKDPSKKTTKKINSVYKPQLFFKND